MNPKQKDFIKRLTSFFNTKFERAEQDDREISKEALADELLGGF